MKLPLKKYLSPSRLKICCGLFILTCFAFSQSSQAQDILPKPKGPYDVGRTVFRLADPSRLEDATPDDTNDIRKISVLLWYPADKNSPSKRAQFTGHGEAFANIMQAAYPDIPLTLIQEAIQQLRPWAKSNPAFASKVSNAPIVLMSHGFGSNPEEYESLAEELASFGYVVAGVNHTYDSNVNMYLPGFPAFSAKDTENVKLHLNGDVFGKHVRNWSYDLRLTLTALEGFNKQADHVLFGKLNTGRVASIGHSLGGAASVVAAYLDKRIDCAANLDGSLWEIGVDQMPTKPVLLFLHDMAGYDPAKFYPVNPTAKLLAKLNAVRSEYDLFRTFTLRQDAAAKQVASAGGAAIELANSGHGAFSDLSLLPGLVTEGETGTIDQQRAHFVINSYVKAFLDEKLRGKASVLLRETSPDFPEISINQPIAD
jgi:dienelactone hydrolase